MEGRKEEGGSEASDLEKAWKIGPHSHLLQSKGAFLSHREVSPGHSDAHSIPLFS